MAQVTLPCFDSCTYRRVLRWPSPSLCTLLSTLSFSRFHLIGIGDRFRQIGERDGESVTDSGKSVSESERYGESVSDIANR